MDSSLEDLVNAIDSVRWRYNNLLETTKQNAALKWFHTQTPVIIKKRGKKHFILFFSRPGLLWEMVEGVKTSWMWSWGDQTGSCGYARAPMGSQAGRTMGSFCMTSSTSEERKFLSTTTSYTYSENHSSVMIRYPAGRERDEARTADRDKWLKWEMSKRKIARWRSGTLFNLLQQKLLDEHQIAMLSRSSA